MKRNLIADRPNGMTREDKMILEELEGRYGTSAVTAAIVNGSFPADDAQETVTVEDAGIGDLRGDAVTLIRMLEGYKIRVREIHWAATHISEHNLAKKTIGELDEFEDDMAEELMGLGEKTIQIGEITPIFTKETVLVEVVNEIVNVLKTFRNTLEQQSAILDGMISIVDDLLHGLKKIMYLTRMA